MSIESYDDDEQRREADVRSFHPLSTLLSIHISTGSYTPHRILHPHLFFLSHNQTKFSTMSVTSINNKPLPASAHVSHKKGDLRSETRTSQYSNFWNKDSARDTDADRDSRLDQYTDVVNGELAVWWLW